MAGQQITQMLVAWRAGDPSALEDLIPLVYHELHRMARICLSSEPHNQILQPTALVNEAVVRLLDWEPEQWGPHAFSRRLRNVDASRGRALRAATALRQTGR